MTDSHLQTRLERFRAALREIGLEAAAVLPGPNMRYLLGINYHTSERAIAAFFRAEGDPVLALPTMEYPRVRDAMPYPLECFTWEDTEGPAGAFANAVKAAGIEGALGVETLNMRFHEMELIRAGAPGVKFTSADAAFEGVRAHKDAAELAHFREAIRISEEALERALATVKPGMTERQIGGMLQAEILRGGGEMSFLLVQGGEGTSRPHGSMSGRPVGPGDPLLIDFGAMVEGYSADITRTFIMGGAEPDPRFREIYALVKAANEAGRAACAPGVEPQTIDRAARCVIEEGGYGEYFIHRTGHGLGLEIHEPPYIIEGGTQPLEPGNVFTVEPGIYVPGSGGVRIEDNVAITRDGAEILTNFPRELRVVGG